MQWTKEEKVDSCTLVEWECRIMKAVETSQDRQTQEKRKKALFIGLGMQKIPRGLHKHFVLAQWRIQDLRKGGAKSTHTYLQSCGTSNRQTRRFFD